MTAIDQGTLPETYPDVESWGRTGVASVLVVDDEPAACKLLSAILRPPAFRCVTAHNGEEGLVALHRELFDAVVSDLCMPGIDGLAVLAEARRQHPHVAFLVTTGLDDVDVGVQAMRSGADDYLVKPVVESAVLASLERALHRHRLEQQVEDYRHHLEEMVAERTGQLQAALHSVERTYESTLQALGAAIDLRDGDTAGHSLRVCRYSTEIATAMGVSGAPFENILRGAYLHDIGKLGIPDRILLKPGSLTAAERELMQQHVQIGFGLVQGIPFLAGAAEIILTHHERFDGNGYPRGLQGERIPLGGRIFAVADAFDAITSNRPYHRASTLHEGRDTIRREAGRQFDPNVVEVFLRIPEDKWRVIAEDNVKA
jgi:cyclic di-GMP phosphodiesterase